MLGKLGHSIGPILKSFSINPSGGSVSRAATMASFAVTLLLRRVPSLRGARALSVALPWRWYSSLSRDSDSDSTVAFSYGSESGSDESSTPLREKEIMKDIEPIRTLAKDILHSKRYRDGESLNAEDEKEITEKILHYHPHSEDKIGCGLSSIVVYLNIVLFTFAIMLFSLMPLRLLFRNSVVARKTADEEATNSTYEHYVPVLLFHKDPLGMRKRRQGHFGDLTVDPSLGVGCLLLGVVVLLLRVFFSAATGRGEDAVATGRGEVVVAFSLDVVERPPPSFTLSFSSCRQMSPVAISVKHVDDLNVDIGRRWHVLFLWLSQLASFSLICDAP
ncbi:hypothetical protein ZIOFF_003322 [Zingiber officinale]|uniref:Uncharacterized protein n=1 Tax=Zingiber officinale TaxID=94328 RepID=A0A8J5ID44_ZINOF|nr:hypothetical protein ZIOFF_003322 [Zingiber officinale]